MRVQPMKGNRPGIRVDLTLDEAGVLSNDEAPDEARPLLMVLAAAVGAVIITDRELRLEGSPHELMAIWKQMRREAHDAALAVPVEDTGVEGDGDTDDEEDDPAVD